MDLYKEKTDGRKKTMMKISLKKMLVTILATALVMATPVGVMARGTSQPAKVNLAVNRTYKQYDVTGDKKADIFYTRKSMTSNVNNHLKVYVNKKLALNCNIRDDQGGRYETVLCTMNSGTFLSIRFESNMGDEQMMHKLYQYKNGKFMPVFNIQNKLISNISMSGTSVKSVSGNKIVLRASAILVNGPWRKNYTYTYSSGKFKRV